MIERKPIEGKTDHVSVSVSGSIRGMEHPCGIKNENRFHSPILDCYAALLLRRRSFTCRLARMERKSFTRALFLNSSKTLSYSAQISAVGIPRSLANICMADRWCAFSFSSSDSIITINSEPSLPLILKIPRRKQRGIFDPNGDESICIRASNPRPKGRGMQRACVFTIS